MTALLRDRPAAVPTPLSLLSVFVSGRSCLRHGRVHRAGVSSRGRYAYDVVACWQAGELVGAPGAGGHAPGGIIGSAQDAIRADSDLGRAVAGIQLYGGPRKQGICPGIVGAVGVDVHVDQVAQLPAVEAEVHGAVALRVRRFARGIGRVGVPIVRRFDRRRSERDRSTQDRSVEATCGLQRAVVVTVGVVVRVWRCCFTNCSSAVHGCATAPVAFEHTASSELGGRDHNHVVPGGQVVEAVVAAVGGGRAAQHGPGRVPASVRGVQLHRHPVHPHFRSVDGAAVVRVEPDPVAQTEQQRLKSKVKCVVVVTSNT